MESDIFNFYFVNFSWSRAIPIQERAISFTPPTIYYRVELRIDLAAASVCGFWKQSTRKLSDANHWVFFFFIDARIISGKLYAVSGTEATFNLIIAVSISPRAHDWTIMYSSVIRCTRWLIASIDHAVSYTKIFVCRRYIGIYCESHYRKGRERSEFILLNTCYLCEYTDIAMKKRNHNINYDQFSSQTRSYEL